MPHLVCPNCDAINRVALERLSAHPQCGRCHTALLPTVPINISADQAHIWVNRHELPLVVDCWAPWCAPCRQFAPIFHQVASTFAAKASFLKLDTQAFPQLASDWNIRSIPTLLVFKNGREHARMSGALDAPTLHQWVRSALA